MFTAKAALFSIFCCTKCQCGRTWASLGLLCNLAGVCSEEPAASRGGWPTAGPGKGTSPDMAASRLTHIVSPKTLWNNYFHDPFCLFVSFKWFILEIPSIPNKKIKVKINPLKLANGNLVLTENKRLVDCWQQIIYSLDLGLLCFPVASKQMMTIKSRNVYVTHMQISKRVFYVDKQQLRDWSDHELYSAGRFCMSNVLNYCDFI